MKQHHRLQAAVLLFENFTALDAVGPYEVLSRMPNTDVIFVGEDTGQIRNDTGSLALTADADLSEIPHPDIVVVPGGPGQNAHMSNGAIHQWLRQADATSTWTASVCTGSLILAAAGLLAGKHATTHWLALEALAEHGVRPTVERVVFDGKYVSAAGVSAGIDMGLALAATIAGAQAAQSIQLGIEYDPQPPFDAGSPRTAPPAIVDTLRARKTTILGTPPAAL